jgi:hypothetical protein
MVTLDGSMPEVSVVLAKPWSADASSAPLRPKANALGRGRSTSKRRRKGNRRWAVLIKRLRRWLGES